MIAPTPRIPAIWFGLCFSWFCSCCLTSSCVLIFYFMPHYCIWKVVCRSGMTSGMPFSSSSRIPFRVSGIRVIGAERTSCQVWLVSWPHLSSTGGIQVPVPPRGAPRALQASLLSLSPKAVQGTCQPNSGRPLIPGTCTPVCCFSLFQSSLCALLHDPLLSQDLSQIPRPGFRK